MFLAFIYLISGVLNVDCSKAAYVNIYKHSSRREPLREPSQSVFPFDSDLDARRRNPTNKLAHLKNVASDAVVDMLYRR